MSVQWATPAALAALVLLAVPILLHLFSRAPVTRLVVPSLRLLRAQEPRLRHRRRIRDPLLLAVRMGIVTAAVAAVAGPLAITRAQQAQWAGRTARAVVVEEGSGATSAIDAAIADERTSAFTSEVFAGASFDAALPRARAWLDAQPPARREVVFVGARWGHLDPRVSEEMPRAIGLRMRTLAGVDATAAARVWRGVDGRGRSVGARVSVTSDGTRTAAAVEVVDAPAIPVELAAAPADTALVAAVWDGVLADGVFLRPADTWQPVRVEWPGAASPADTAPSDAPLTAADRRRLIGVAHAVTAAAVDVGDIATGTAAADVTGTEATAPWTALAPALRAARRGAALVLRVDDAPEPAAAEQLLRAVLHVAAAASEQATAPEGPAWEARLRAAVERPSAGIDDAAVARIEDRDGRWLWLVAAGGLLVESLLRRRADRQSSPAPRQAREMAS